LSDDWSCDQKPRAGNRGNDDHASAHSDTELDGLESGDFRAVEEFRDIVGLFTDLPRDMFVSQLVKDYAACETDLERLRSTYFEHLKEVHIKDFPFGGNAELRRRVFTRTGDPLTVRLAQDIHNIIDVIEGGDYNLLKPLLSVGKSRRASVVCTERKQRNDISTDKFVSANEFTLLEDTVSSLQSNMLGLKQSMFSYGKLHTENLTTTKADLELIKQCMHEPRLSTINISAQCEHSVCYLTSALIKRITKMEERIRYLECVIEEFTERTLITGESVRNDACMQPEQHYLSSGEVEDAAECPRPHPAGDDVRADELQRALTTISFSLYTWTIVRISTHRNQRGTLFRSSFLNGALKIRTYTMTLLCQQGKNKIRCCTRIE